MKKKVLSILFVVLVSVITFLSMIVARELDDIVYFMPIFLFPFAWLTTVFYCKFFAPHIRKRVAGLTIFSIFFVTTLFYSFVQKTIEESIENREPVGVVGTCCSVL